MTQSNFQDALKNDSNFSYDGTEALYNYYEEYSEDMGTPFEFDAVAIRMDWSEYDSLAEAYKDYAYEVTDDMTDEDIIAYFEDNTTLIELDNGHVLLMTY